jgi:hypothetical protein
MRFSTAILVGMAAFATAQLDPSVQSAADAAASSAVAEASADGSLSDIAAEASAAVTSLQQALSTLDPAARSSVSAELSSYGIDFASVTSALNEPLATGSSSSDSDDQSTGTGAQTTSARTTGLSASAAQTSASTTGSEGMAAATALPIAAIGAGLALVGML